VFHPDRRVRIAYNYNLNLYPSLTAIVMRFESGARIPRCSTSTKGCSLMTKLRSLICTSRVAADQDTSGRIADVEQQQARRTAPV
jgi:hypothetical protein